MLLFIILLWFSSCDLHMHDLKILATLHKQELSFLDEQKKLKWILHQSKDVGCM